MIVYVVGLISAGERERARQVLDSALRRQPDHVGVRRLLDQLG